MKEFIFEKEESLSKEYCQELINLFETYISYKVNNDCCNNTGIIDCKNHYTVRNVSFIELKKDLFIVLNNELEKYFDEYKKNDFYDLSSIENKLIMNDYKILKYDMNSGESSYQYEHPIEKEFCKLISFIWFLNDCENGGELELFGNYKIKPKTGKFVMFPADWFIPFCNKISYSSHKYIVKGFLYILNN